VSQPASSRRWRKENAEIFRVQGGSDTLRLMSDDDEIEAAPRSLRGVAAASERLIGADVDGRYVLNREIGRGGLCMVFLAEHRYSGRPFALKLLHPEYRDHPEARKRLLTEARLLGAIDHPYVVSVADAGIVRGGGLLDRMPFLVMERLHAKSVEAMVTARGKLTLRDTMTIARFAAEALGAAHAVEIVHRDVKPGNLLVVRKPDGHKGLKLIDFGVAIRAQREALDGPASSVVGTPVYMAPEHMAGHRVTPAADVWSLAVTIYECLTGQVPFNGTFEQVYAQAATLPRPDVRRLRPDVPDALAALLRRALSLDPGARPADGTVMLYELDLVHAAMTAGVTARDYETSRRGHVRVPYRAPVEMALPGGVVADGAIQDLSESGIFVVTDAKVLEGVVVVLRFALPSGHIVATEAAVRWSKESATQAKTALGLEFKGLDAQARFAIAEYVRRAELA